MESTMRYEKDTIDGIESWFLKAERVIVAIFVGINSVINNVEYAFLNLVAAIIPWVVFLLPASMTFENVGLYLGFDRWLQWVSAIVIEALGIVAGAELVDDILHNRKQENRAKAKKTKPIVSFSASIFYLVLTVLVNAILEAQSEDVTGAHIAVKIMLTLMGAVAIAIVSSRKFKYELSSDNRQKDDSSDTSDNYTTYDYRLEVGKLSVGEKAELLEMGEGGLRNYFIQQFPNIDPGRARIWVKNVVRDLNERR